jgi:hypothetical protein
MRRAPGARVRRWSGPDRAALLHKRGLPGPPAAHFGVAPRDQRGRLTPMRAVTSALNQAHPSMNCKLATTPPAAPRSPTGPRCPVPKPVASWACTSIPACC